MKSSYEDHVAKAEVMFDLCMCFALIGIYWILICQHQRICDLEEKPPRVIMVEGNIEVYDDGEPEYQI